MLKKSVKKFTQFQKTFGPDRCWRIIDVIRLYSTRLTVNLENTT